MRGIYEILATHPTDTITTKELITVKKKKEATLLLIKFNKISQNKEKTRAKRCKYQWNNANSSFFLF